MNSFDLLVSVASWEDRFTLGLKKDIALYNPKKAILFFYKEYEKWSASARMTARRICKRSGMPVDFDELSFEDHATSWKRLGERITQRVGEGMSVLVDISTMPRDAIWEIFFFLEFLGCKAAYVYHRPEIYADWLSRDPDRPRLVYKLSGIASLGCPTVLVAITGYDADRTRQLFNFLQPEFGLLGIQVGDQYENQVRNAEKHLSIEGGPFKFRSFPVDAYSQDHGESSIVDAIERHREANVVMSSLGPKPSAVALYRIHKRYPAFGLCYAPSREFNQQYSRGISGSLFGWL